MSALGPLMANGGLILHGEQEFIYHRPIVVGDVLVSEGKVIDAYQKESKGKTMTFIVSETNWSDDATGEPVATAQVQRDPPCMAAGGPAGSATRRSTGGRHHG